MGPDFLSRWAAAARSLPMGQLSQMALSSSWDWTLDTQGLAGCPHARQQGEACSSAAAQHRMLMVLGLVSCALVLTRDPAGEPEPCGATGQAPCGAGGAAEVAVGVGQPRGRGALMAAQWAVVGLWQGEIQARGEGAEHAQARAAGLQLLALLACLPACRLPDSVSI